MRTNSNELTDGNGTVVLPEKLAYSIHEAILATGLGRTFLYDRMMSGELKSRKLGGRRVILKNDLMEYLNSSPPGQGLSW
ncbi:helix-turn-helix domain-containing protein [Asticcacaulis excentricus]|uniref:Helix-turn-helix domain-containing protein n=1 Tax=Asticcacaulis excentricus (strain ATCC 15261 / DSM 4724 / KCTC 12464 / NCIMB 9791 / VKM B-1370 / CB 48) TaxID=573065 RepID=E8RUU2_ASTEC|nr:helix-turn-helix domain-containing protein [Asticcacaulis excentricus]ADU14142.1 hypothetical protein Astex_2491 [Asticcacaulis excentricus CB 48]